MDSVAVRFPLAVGVNLMLIVHLPPGAMGEEGTQLSPELEKSPALVPVLEMDATVSGPSPVFCTVTICAELEVPTNCDAKAKLVVERDAKGTGVIFATNASSLPSKLD
jgi:hypothetical protein